MTCAYAQLTRLSRRHALRMLSAGALCSTRTAPRATGAKREHKRPLGRALQKLHFRALARAAGHAQFLDAARALCFSRRNRTGYGNRPSARASAGGMFRVTTIPPTTDNEHHAHRCVF